MAAAALALAVVQGLLRITIDIHMTLAFSAFFLFPIQFFTQKGSRNHIRLGRLGFAISVGVVSFGLIVLFNPRFASYWQDDIVRHEWTEFRSAFGAGASFLVWVVVFYGYFVFSALRVWPRWRAFKQGAPTSNVIDWALTAFAIGFGAYYAGLAIVKWIDGNQKASHLLPLTLVMLGFGIWDVVTYFRPIDGYRRAYFSHGTRLFMAWWQLLVGVLIRRADVVCDTCPRWHAWAVQVGVTALFIGLVVYWDRQLSPRKPAEPSHDEGVPAT